MSFYWNNYTSSLIRYESLGTTFDFSLMDFSFVLPYKISRLLFYKYLQQLAALVLCLANISPSFAQDEFYQLPPITYDKAIAKNTVTQLAENLASGKTIFKNRSGVELLKEVLARFDVPEESQVLVFSKTSKQTNYISPKTPRALYFNDHIYIGYALGGHIEITVIDPLLGSVFYVMKPDREKGIVIDRDNSCLSCHGGARSNGVPGIFVRSVTTDGDGLPIAGKNDFLTLASSPISERWGGWYVTGRHHGFTHLGNSYDGDGRTMDETQNIQALDAFFDTARYPQSTSDILALMLLEHQCEIQNVFTSAAFKYQRALWLSRAMDSLETEHTSLNDDSKIGKIVSSVASDIVSALLFEREFNLGDKGIEGSPAFQNYFEAQAKKDSRGYSLRELRLYGHIFKNRCSYMIYSPSFHHLPQPIRKEVFQQLRDNLTNQSGHAKHITVKECNRILNILDETIEEF